MVFSLRIFFFVRRISEEAFLKWLKKTVDNQFPNIIYNLNSKLKENPIELPSLQGINWNSAVVKLQKEWVTISSDITN